MHLSLLVDQGDDDNRLKRIRLKRWLPASHSTEGAPFSLSNHVRWKWRAVHKKRNSVTKKKLQQKRVFPGQKKVQQKRVSSAVQKKKKKWAFCPDKKKSSRKGFQGIFRPKRVSHALQEKCVLFVREKKSTRQGCFPSCKMKACLTCQEKNIPVETGVSRPARKGPEGNGRIFCVQRDVQVDEGVEKGGGFSYLNLCNGSDQQLRNIFTDGTIRNKRSGFCLYTATPGNEQRVDFGPCGRKDNADQWQLRGDGTITNRYQNRCLDNRGQELKVGNPIQVYECINAWSEKWWIGGIPQRALQADITILWVTKTTKEVLRPLSEQTSHVCALPTLPLA